jgi:2-haloacid dehalogenase
MVLAALGPRATRYDIAFIKGAPTFDQKHDFEPPMGYYLGCNQIHSNDSRGGIVMTRPLTDFKALSFDCYGTLIDWETGIWDALQPLLMANECTSIFHDDALDSFARHESSVEVQFPRLIYREILSRVHAAFAEEFSLDSTPALDENFGRSVAFWPAFPDTADALRYLKTRYRLVILSNVDQESFAASKRKLGVEFDAVYTAEAIGSYKPSLANFHYLLEHVDSEFGLGSDDVLHTAQSLYHDHAPARHLGLANAWIDRQKLSEQGGWGATTPLASRPAVDYRFFSMGEMADAVRGAED